MWWVTLYWFVIYWNLLLYYIVLFIIVIYSNLVICMYWWPCRTGDGDSAPISLGSFEEDTAPLTEKSTTSVTSIPESDEEEEGKRESLLDVKAQVRLRPEEWKPRATAYCEPWTKISVKLSIDWWSLTFAIYFTGWDEVDSANQEQRRNRLHPESHGCEEEEGDAHQEQEIAPHSIRFRWRLRLVKIVMR